MSLSWGNNAENRKHGSSRNPDRRVNKSSKYDGVQSKVNSGSTINKAKFVTKNQMLKRASEDFFRISPAQLYQLLQEYEADDAMEDIAVNRAQTDFGPRIVVHEEEAVAEYERPYLILDVRTAAEFEQGHVLQARSFPQRLLMQDKSSSELVHYRNRESCLIVLYENDDRLAAAAAQILTHRGFDNIYVLHGGLMAFSDKFPSYVEGDAPLPPQSDSGRGGTARSQLASSRSRLGTGQSTASVNRSDLRSSHSHTSHASHASRATHQSSALVRRDHNRDNRSQGYDQGYQGYDKGERDAPGTSASRRVGDSRSSGGYGHGGDSRGSTGGGQQQSGGVYALRESLSRPPQNGGRGGDSGGGGNGYRRVDENREYNRWSQQDQDQGYNGGYSRGGYDSNSGYTGSRGGDRDGRRGAPSVISEANSVAGSIISQSQARKVRSYR
mmetsp:Transcript_26192/g.61433  ORF Transcript_26192/g.61433 Transcript_26192/m.61433 type:complete len:441 (-) Transcript_26192:832-2154(-)